MLKLNVSTIVYYFILHDSAIAKECGNDFVVCQRDMGSTTSCSEEMEYEEMYYFPIGSTKELYMDLKGSFMFDKSKEEKSECVSLKFMPNVPSCCK